MPIRAAIGLWIGSGGEEPGLSTASQAVLTASARSQLVELAQCVQELSQEVYLAAAGARRSLDRRGRRAQGAGSGCDACGYSSGAEIDLQLTVVCLALEVGKGQSFYADPAQVKS